MNTASRSDRPSGTLNLGQVRLRHAGQESRWSICDLDQDSIELAAMGTIESVPAHAQIELIWPATAADPAFAVVLRSAQSNGRRLRLSLQSLDERLLEAIRNRVQGRQGSVPQDATERAVELIERRIRATVAGRLRLLLDEAESELRPGTETELFWNGSPPGQVRQQLAKMGSELIDVFVEQLIRPLRGEQQNPSAAGATRRAAGQPAPGLV